jgi:hypothetical protein
MKAEWISTIASIITALGVIFVAFQAYFAKQQLDLTVKKAENDHERLRRQTTIELMLKWIENLDIKTASARKLVESLDDSACEKIYNMEKVKISLEHKTLLQGILDLKEERIKDSDSFIEITDYESSIIRSYVLNYLNSLETILTGWRLSVVDKVIAEDEFIYLYNTEKDKCVLHNFRNIAGVHPYPSIKAFCESLNNKFSKEKIATKENIL